MNKLVILSARMWMSTFLWVNSSVCHNQLKGLQQQALIISRSRKFRARQPWGRFTHQLHYVKVPQCLLCDSLSFTLLATGSTTFHPHVYRPIAGRSLFLFLHRSLNTEENPPPLGFHWSRSSQSPCLKERKPGKVSIWPFSE